MKIFRLKKSPTYAEDLVAQKGLITNYLIHDSAALLIYNI
jgi:hypothetical protein